MAELELKILDGIQEVFGSAFSDCFFPAVTKLGNAGMIWIVLTLLLVIVPRTRRAGYMAAFSLALEAAVCNLILKPMVARIRPCDLAEGIQLLIGRPEDYSFPSGHTSAGFAVAAALLLSGSRLGIPTLVLAVMIAFSRLYLYVHFPTDVLAGALLGIAAALVVRSCKNVTERRKNRL
ncbi:MAG: phosphatase PAP2 family protein [Eubacteriales bacterium]|nr:phosphatase PAP2 family protein [Eubacteriales bacterium]